MKKLMAFFASIILSIPFVASAQKDTATYIDNLNVQDSSYMQQNLQTGAETASSGNSTVVIIIVVVVIIAIAAFIILRKKKK